MKTVNTDIFIDILLTSGCIESPDLNNVFSDPVNGYFAKKLISPCKNRYVIINVSSDELLMAEVDAHLSRLNLDDLIGNIPFQ